MLRLLDARPDPPRLSAPAPRFAARASRHHRRTEPTRPPTSTAGPCDCSLTSYLVPEPEAPLHKRHHPRTCLPGRGNGVGSRPRLNGHYRHVQGYAWRRTARGTHVIIVVDGAGHRAASLAATGHCSRGCCSFPVLRLACVRRGGDGRLYPKELARRSAVTELSVSRVTRQNTPERASSLALHRNSL